MTPNVEGGLGKFNTQWMVEPELDGIVREQTLFKITEDRKFGYL